MADIILHRRSLGTGSVPTTHSLGVAQFAINVPDGKVFIHKSSSVAESIISVVTTDSITTGSIRLTGTASAGLFIGQFSGSFSGNSSNAATASYVENLSQNVTITGSLFVSGGTFSGSGANIYDISASSILGLNLAAISSGSATASLTFDASGSSSLQINTNTAISGTLTVSTSLDIKGTQTTTGSVAITGSLIVFTSLTGSPEFQVSNTGIKIGNVLSDSHTTTGSVGITGSFGVIGNQTLSGSLNLHQSASVSGTNIFGTASWAVSTFTASFVPNTISKMVYVSSGSGLDTNDGSSLRPVKTISQSLVLMGNQAGRIAIHPGTYPESVTITQANVTLASSTPGQGSDTYISGTVTFNATAGASKMFMLTANTVIHTGSANLYMDGVTVNTSFNKTGNGFTEIFDCALQGSTLSTISGPGTVLLTNSKDNFLYISNSAAVVTIKDSVSSVSPTLLAGTLAAFDSIFYSIASGSPAITTSTGSTIGTANCQMFNPLGQNERVSFGGSYFYSDTTFNRVNSTLRTSVGTRSEFIQLRADGVTGSFTGSFIGNITNADTASFVNSGFTINSSSIFSLATTSSTLGVNNFSIVTGSSRGSVLHYTVTSASNGRTGQVMTSWIGSSIVYAETQTPDIGSTAGVSFTSSLSGANSVYTFGTATAGWNIEFLVTQI